ncbi:hypothetical protein H70357_23335 [Paenibacillus sp. FSL H7-0357]|uniref:hypothetical protein n=1 Tax=unclassified Paenibacillus TaxID=185978 RepID=UPI0004F91D0B|nr:hypothetical protein [Paenibacillus sp. FSL H7-0357]AIQ19314.1 hypothetical protein H70357_23335 [Paenibacillus sp. FSL H7-0357]
MFMLVWGWLGLANKVGDWYPVSVPGAVMIYRYSWFNNIDEGYAGEPPVLVIERKPEFMGQNNG